jgi:hypothetical protein
MAMRTAETNQSLWLLASAPAIWAAHFMVSYVTAAIWCAKAGTAASVDGVQQAVAIFTAVALAAIVWIGWAGYRRYAHGREDELHRDTAADRHRFLGFATLLMAGLSAVATLYVALAAVFFETCR